MIFSAKECTLTPRQMEKKHRAEDLKRLSQKKTCSGFQSKHRIAIKMSVFFHMRICSGITAEVRFDSMICSVGASGSGAVLFWLAGFRVQLTGMRWGRPLCRRALAMPSRLWGGEAGPLQ